MTEDILDRLAKSKFRSSFRLSKKYRDYAAEKGAETIRRHAEDFIAARLGTRGLSQTDGHQTPMKNHPVFIAQHATATCCRGCFEKWHGIPPGTELTPEQQKYAVDLIMRWIERQTTV